MTWFNWGKRSCIRCGQSDKPLVFQTLHTSEGSHAVDPKCQGGCEDERVAAMVAQRVDLELKRRGLGP